MYTLRRELLLPAPIHEVWSFFSDARNLATLTPPRLRFEVLNEGEIEMREGTQIDYRLRVRGVPIRWQSAITVWEPPHRFVDEQRRGPYRCWIHEHAFEAAGNGTIARDLVRYDHLGGRLVNRLLVAPDLRRIFDFREKALRRVFAGASQAPGATVAEA